jgi:hypothetical protein
MTASTSPGDTHDDRAFAGRAVSSSRSAFPRDNQWDGSGTEDVERTDPLRIFQHEAHPIATTDRSTPSGINGPVVMVEDACGIRVALKRLRMFKNLYIANVKSRIPSRLLLNLLFTLFCLTERKKEGITIIFIFYSVVRPNITQHLSVGHHLCWKTIFPHADSRSA